MGEKVIVTEPKPILRKIKKLTGELHLSEIPLEITLEATVEYFEEKMGIKVEKARLATIPQTTIYNGARIFEIEKSRLQEIKTAFYLKGFLTKTWYKGCIYHRKCYRCEQTGHTPHKCPTNQEGPKENRNQTEELNKQQRNGFPQQRNQEISKKLTKSSQETLSIFPRNASEETRQKLTGIQEIKMTNGKEGNIEEAEKIHQQEEEIVLSQEKLQKKKYQQQKETTKTTVIATVTTTTVTPQNEQNKEEDYYKKRAREEFARVRKERERKEMEGKKRNEEDEERCRIRKEEQIKRNEESGFMIQWEQLQNKLEDRQKRIGNEIKRKKRDKENNEQRFCLQQHECIE